MDYKTIKWWLFSHILLASPDDPGRVDVKPAMQGVRKKKQRRRRGKAKTQPKQDNQEATVTHHAEERASANSSDVGVTPIAAHHPAVVDLTTCDSVSYALGLMR